MTDICHKLVCLHVNVLKSNVDLAALRFQNACHIGHTCTRFGLGILLKGDLCFLVYFSARFILVAVKRQGVEFSPRLTEPVSLDVTSDCRSPRISVLISDAKLCRAYGLTIC